MKWFLCDRVEDLEEFTGNDDSVKNVKDVEVVFDDGVPTGVLIELKDGMLLHFCSKKTDDDGSRRGLNVSTTKEIE